MFSLLQVDLDLGNYERFLDIKLNKDNNITTGKVYQVCYPPWAVAAAPEGHPAPPPVHSCTTGMACDVAMRGANRMSPGLQSVIEKERRGDFLGKTVQVVPHITDAIQVSAFVLCCDVRSTTRCPPQVSNSHTCRVQACVV